jgi:ribonuclease R
VQVILDRILAQERRLQFSIVEEGIPLTGKKPVKSSSKQKTKKTGRAGTPKPSAKGKRHPARKGKRR